MDHITLRKCTMKSKLGFGTYPNDTIERIVAAQHFRYLRKVYYTVAWIDFTDDIKEACHIIYPIDKPGTSPELNERTNMEMDQKMIGAFGMKAVSNRNKNLRRSERERHISEAFGEHLSKGQLQAINHGKM